MYNDRSYALAGRRPCEEVPSALWIISHVCICLYSLLDHDCASRHAWMYNELRGTVCNKHACTPVISLSQFFVTARSAHLTRELPWKLQPLVSEGDLMSPTRRIEHRGLHDHPFSGYNCQSVGQVCSFAGWHGDGRRKTSEHKSAVS